ncbi:MAG: YqaJ viral recombinase family protein [Sulfobacillus sp.]
MASKEFDFGVVVDTPQYRHWIKSLIDGGRIHDVTDAKWDNFSAGQVPEEALICLTQKSPAWLDIRGKAIGTGSSIGKYLPTPSCRRFPKPEQVEEAWQEKLVGGAAPNNQLMSAHTRWGTVHEDAAMGKFIDIKDKPVTKVGIIKVPMKFIWQSSEGIGQIGQNTDQIQGEPNTDQFLLVSPDGIIGKPDDRPVGMLEIKCISPFHHLETDGHLTWVSDLDSRQWHSVDEIPYVYLVQMGLQAVAGTYFCEMTEAETMYFIRWCPYSCSVFSFSFRHLLPFGIAAAKLYSLLYNRMKAPSVSLPPGSKPTIFPLMQPEIRLQDRLEELYGVLRKEVQFEFHEYDDFPTFDLYRKVTKDFKFRLPEFETESEPDAEEDVQMTPGVCLL